MKIAIFGGSFDPPHIGHEAIVKEALKTLDIDKLCIVPTFLNPFKKTFFLDAPIRLDLLKKLFASYKKVEICEYEVSQQKAVYTIETVKYLQQLYRCEKIYLIIGEDNLQKLHLWKFYEELKQCVEFVIALREGYSQGNDLLKGLKTLNINVPISSTSIRDTFDLSLIPETIKKQVKEILQKGE
ncbi:MAG: nicotinate (nicotinamide) nucleotide adenylyltransferase [Candidatus Marinarcus sp.]|uniref:nicotinate (nicotinamide) nucleotide adenylyltransferase n=1 Tax=Candidatus Marinarcus sp. TaxID=3100987 RepID=UPI003AFF622E